MKMRLDKFLTELSPGSRSEVKKWIRQKKVQVNGKTVIKPEEKVDPNKDQVILDGTRLVYCQYEYFMLNKPSGYISATTDPEHPVVLDLITEQHRKGLFPAGRLDIDTEGLLLITNDGELSHRLLSPRYHVDKTYLVRVQGEVTPEDCKMLEQGMDIGDEKPTLPAVVEGVHQVSSAPDLCELSLTIREGRYHQVKRMFGRLGKPVVYLKRLRMGSLVLDDKLKLGEYRRLSEREIQELKQPDFSYGKI